MSFLQAQSRFWAVPDRLKQISLPSGKIFHEKDWTDREDVRRWRHECWKWGAFIRNLPTALKVKYKLRVLEPKEIEEIKKLAEKEGFIRKVIAS